MVLRVPPIAGPLLLAAPIVAVAARGRHRWNGLAVVTTLAALLLVALVVSRTASGPVPVVFTGGASFGWLTDAGALIGYVSVFSLRAPDFSHGLRSRRDLAFCVGMLVGSALLVAVAGAALARATGTMDVVAAISGVSAPLLGNPWLELLAVLLPPLLVPMVGEAVHRRRDGAPRLVVAAMWLPGSVIGVAAAPLGSTVAPILGLVAAGIATAVVRSRNRWAQD